MTFETLINDDYRAPDGWDFFALAAAYAAALLLGMAGGC